MKPKYRKCSICKARKEVCNLRFAEMKCYCSPECGAILGLQMVKKKRDTQDKLVKSKHKKQKDEFYRKDLAWQHKNTQTVFNRVRVKQERLLFARLGIEPFCISCKKTNMDFCCGHYKTVGSQGGLRYDENNTFLQCNRYCNKALSGNIAGNKNTIGYTNGLISRFGEAKGNSIIEYCETNTSVKKWRCDEIESIRFEYLALEKLLDVELSKHEAN